MYRHWFIDRWIDVTSICLVNGFCEGLVRRDLRARGLGFFDARAFAAWAVGRKLLGRRRERRVMAGYTQDNDHG